MIKSAVVTWQDGLSHEKQTTFYLPFDIRVDTLATMFSVPGSSGRPLINRIQHTAVESIVFHE